MLSSAWERFEERSSQIENVSHLFSLILSNRIIQWIFISLSFFSVYSFIFYYIHFSPSLCSRVCQCVWLCICPSVCSCICQCVCPCEYPCFRPCLCVCILSLPMYLFLCMLLAFVSVRVICHLISGHLDRGASGRLNWECVAINPWWEFQGTNFGHWCCSHYVMSLT